MDETRGRRRIVVRQLGYLELDVVDLDAWQDLLEGVLGCDVRRDSNGSLRVRIDERRHRLGLRAAANDTIRAVGWELADDRALEVSRDELANRGVDVVEGTRSECTERAVRRFIRFRDPAGITVELSCGAVIDDATLELTCGVSSFNASDLGLGHIVVFVADLATARDFYRDVLGFGVSDEICINGLEAAFMHCNARHHSLAFVEAPDERLRGSLAHFLLETGSLDDVGRGYDRCLDRGVPIVMSLGRHVNDHMTSFYLRTPSGYEIEYGAGGLLIDPRDWTVGRYEVPSLWGHRRLGEEYVTP